MGLQQGHLTSDSTALWGSQPADTYNGTNILKWVNILIFKWANILIFKWAKNKQVNGILLFIEFHSCTSQDFSCYIPGSFTTTTEITTT